MASVLEAVGALEGVLAAGLAVFLLARGFRNPPAWVLSGLLLTFGFFTAYVSLPGLFDFAPGRTYLLAALAMGTLAYSFNFAFAVVYPHWVLNARKAWFLLWSFIPAGVVAAYVLLQPERVLHPDGSPTATMGYLDELLFGLSYLPAMWVFGRHWLATEPSLYRRQFMYVLAPFMLWNLHDGMFVLVATVEPALASGPPFDGVVVAIAFVQVLSVAAIAAATLLHARGVGGLGGAPGRDDRNLLQWALTGFAASFLQFLGFELHVLVDGLILILLFYGVAKYQILDIDLKVKFGIKSGALGSIGVIIMLIVQQAVEQYVGSTFGNASIVLGAIVAGIALFALTPVQRWAEGLSQKALPKAEPTEAYLTYRKFELYRVALEGMLRDGVLDVKEAGALKALRTELRISTAEHDLLEQELREKLAPAPPKAAAPA